MGEPIEVLRDKLGAIIANYGIQNEQHTMLLNVLERTFTQHSASLVKEARIDEWERFKTSDGFHVNAGSPDSVIRYYMKRIKALTKGDKDE